MKPPHHVLVCHSIVDDAHCDALLRHVQPLVDRGILAVDRHDVECTMPRLQDYAAVVVLMSPEMAATACLSTVMLPAVPVSTRSSR